MFSARLVLALLAGRKTQTRRTVKPQPKSDWLYPQEMWGVSPPPDPLPFGVPGHWRWVGEDYPDGPEDDFRCRYGRAGDRLWVREAWGLALDSNGWANGGATLTYRADGKQLPLTADRFDLLNTVGQIKTWHRKWRPGIHMPRWAARIILEIESIRVEKLQKISTDDIVAEGLEIPAVDYSVADHPWALDVERDNYAREQWRTGWDSINGAGSWKKNPWVWVVTFKRIQ